MNVLNLLAKLREKVIDKKIDAEEELQYIIIRRSGEVVAVNLDVDSAKMITKLTKLIG